MPDRLYLKKLFTLFFTFAKIAALVVGGGYAILPVVEETFHKKHHWISDEELLDMMGLVQTIPGIIACNSAIYVGMKVAGIGGVLAAAFGVCLPSVIIIMIIAAFFPHLKPDNVYLAGAFQAVRACITALLIVTACKMVRKVLKGPFEILVMLGSFLLVLRKVEVLYIIPGAMFCGILYHAWHNRKKLEWKDGKEGKGEKTP